MLIIQLNDLKMAIYLKITNPTEVVKKKTSKWLTDITPERIDRKLVEEEVIKALNSNFFIQTINNLIEENKYNLLEERIRLREIDAYGNEDYKKWIGNPPLEEKAIEKNIFNGSKRFKEGIPYFWEKVILKKFGSMELFFEKWRSYCNENPTIDDEILGSIRKLETEDWFVFIAIQIEKSCLNLLEKQKLFRSK